MPMRCGRGIHDGGFRLYPWSGHCAAHGTGGKTDTRMAAYPFHLPSVRQGVDIQDAVLFSKPYWGLDGCPIPFITLHVEIPLCRKGGKTVARHGTPSMVGGRCGWERWLVPLYQECAYRLCSIWLLQETVMQEESGHMYNQIVP